MFVFELLGVPDVLMSRLFLFRFVLVSQGCLAAVSFILLRAHGRFYAEDCVFVH